MARKTGREFGGDKEKKGEGRIGRSKQGLHQLQGGAASGGEETKVADFDKAFGEDVPAPA